MMLKHFTRKISNNVNRRFDVSNIIFKIKKFVSVQVVKS